MKFLSTAAAFLLLAPLSASTPSPSFFDTQSPINPNNDGPPVNGDNPLKYCSDQSSYILQIDTVNLQPNPPQPYVLHSYSFIYAECNILTYTFRGQTLTIRANGTLKEDVEKGAKVLLVVKYGLITILNGEVNLCDQIKEVDLSCPLKKGDMTLTKKVDLPKQIPPVCLGCLHRWLSKVLRPNISIGQIHCACRRLHQRRRSDHLSRGKGNRVQIRLWTYPHKHQPLQSAGVSNKCDKTAF